MGARLAATAPAVNSAAIAMMVCRRPNRSETAPVPRPPRVAPNRIAAATTSCMAWGSANSSVMERRAPAMMPVS